MIPVYINNMNLLTWPARMVDQLLCINGCVPVILDNGSTYPPLLDYYRRWCPCRVVHLGRNLGHLAPWESGVVAREIGEFYAVTDPDLDLSTVPADVFARLRQGLVRYPWAVKAGLSLAINDLPGDSPLREEVIRWESQFWQRRLDGEFFAGAIDTTFALYHKGKGIEFPGTGPAVRGDNPLTARHLPWYLAPWRLNEELGYYLEHIENITHWSGRLRTQYPVPT